MTRTLKYKKGKEFLWAISQDKNEIFIMGKKFHAIKIKEDNEAQELINSI